MTTHTYNMPRWLREGSSVNGKTVATASTLADVARAAGLVGTSFLLTCALVGVLIWSSINFVTEETMRRYIDDQIATRVPPPEVQTDLATIKLTLRNQGDDIQEIREALRALTGNGGR
jgi:hypothetical protein